MPTRSNCLIEVLRRPERLAELTLSDWDELLVEARATRLFGSIVAAADRLQLADRLPPRVAWHLESARMISRRHDQLVRYEVACLAATLREIDTPVVLLKGTAYRLLDLPLAAGRLSGDIDLLVRRAQLDDVEAALRRDDWIEEEMPPDQQRYFRRWLHELPPLTHRVRGTKLDVHHNILPAIDNLQVDAELLLAAAQPLDNSKTLFTLAPADMLLHCAAHLFRNGHYETGLRDLVDFEALLEHFSKDASFFDTLLRRAIQLNLRAPLYLALRYSRELLGAVAPQEILAELHSHRPNRLLRAALDRLVPLAVLPAARNGVDRRRRTAHWLLARYPLCLWKKTVLPKVERLMLPARPKQRPNE